MDAASPAGAVPNTAVRISTPHFVDLHPVYGELTIERPFRVFPQSVCAILCRTPDKGQRCGHETGGSALAHPHRTAAIKVPELAKEVAFVRSFISLTQLSYRQSR